MRKLLLRIPIKTIFIIVSLVLQTMWIVVSLYCFRAYGPFIASMLRLAALLVAVYIVGGYGVSAFKTVWILVILAAPVLGLLLYLLFGREATGRHVRERYQHARESMGGSLLPEYCVNKVEYHGLGEEAIEALIMDLYNAREYIFMEYFIMDEQGQVWQRIENALTDRAAAGVEIRILYDAMGCISLFSDKRARALQERGIAVRRFNPITPWIAGFMNNRDHRKLAVMDGLTAYTGGWNLSDEYANLKSPFGHWKDTGVRLEGEAVNGFVQIFLEMWNFASGEALAAREYLRCSQKSTEKGKLILYANAPVMGEHTGLEVYQTLFRMARKYLYVTTPYLICDDELIHAICLAAKCGVDVRIIVPGIPDKKLVYVATKSCFRELLRNGVRIYLYQKGFIHAKMAVCDDRAAVVGTANLDFRSLYHHFENGVILLDSPVVEEIHEDFLRMFAEGLEVSEQECVEKGMGLRVLEAVFRVLAPLL